MPRDLLAELRRKVSLEDELKEGYVNHGFEKDTLENGHFHVIHMENLGNPLKAFEEIEDLWIKLKELKGQIDLTKLEHENILNSVNPDESAKSELESLMNTIKKNSADIRTRLKSLESGIKEGESNVEKSDGSKVLTEIRMRKSQSAALAKTFVNTINDYQIIQTEYRDRCKGRIKRQIEIAGDNVTDEQVEEMIEHGNWTAFGQSIIEETQQARLVLADVQSRHNDLLKLEQSIRELHELFMEMAILVENQGEMIDRIETHVSQAEEYVEASVLVLARAVKLQSSSRKKKICIIITVIILLIVLALIIYFSIPKGN